jgi:hypothetical protein
VAREIVRLVVILMWLVDPEKLKLSRRERLITLAPLLVVFFAVQFTRVALASNDTTQLDARQADFREVWSSDPCDVQRQSWNDYWGWVQKFYFGNGPWKGWFAYSADIVSNVKSAATKTTLSKELATLGRRVAGEWAKDNHCRKIRTTTGIVNFSEAGKPAIEGWADALTKATSLDSGDGNLIQQAVDQIRSQVNQVLGSPR